MIEIVRSSGSTDSERYLAKLAERTFLNLWSYPNVFIDKRANAKGDGKELCDLLIVCGDHVIIFSDKTIGWPETNDVELAWRRWYRRAIEKSVAQVRRAERWLDGFTDRIFLDAACTQPLPLPLPPKERRRVHGIVVARGAGEASRKYFGEGIGSLMIVPEIRDADHVRKTGLQPLAIGDVAPDGSFVHVLDDATLDIVMSELDTITDLTEYLSRKEVLVRSGRLITAGGEEDLLAYYMTHLEAPNQHGFPKPDGSPWQAGDAFVIGSGTYGGITSHAQYIAKKQADRASYVWDALIETFTKHMLAGTTVVREGETFELRKYEEGVRRMALVPRYLRREYGAAILDAMKRGASVGRFTRGLLPGPGASDRETGFFFMTFAVPNLDLAGSYEQYRRVRVRFLSAYAFTFLRRHPNLKRIIGIATEPPPEAGVSRGSSEDMIVAEVSAWTSEFIAQLEEEQKKLDIVREGNYREYTIGGKEFPDVEPDKPATPAAGTDSNPPSN